MAVEKLLRKISEFRSSGKFRFTRQIRIGGDTGKPIVIMEPESEQAQMIQSDRETPCCANKYNESFG